MRINRRLSCRKLIVPIALVLLLFFSETFAQQGTPYMIVQSFWDGTQWVDQSRSKYLYNASGQPVEHIQEFWDNSSWSYAAKGSFLYFNDSLSQNSTFFWDGSVWIPYFIRYLTRDIQKFLIADTTYIVSGSGLDPANRTSYRYNQAFKVDTELVEGWFTNYWEPQLLTEKLYDVSGLQTINVVSTWGSPGWTPVMKDTFIYSAGLLAEQIIQQFSGNMWSNTARMTFSYNTNATPQVVEDIFYNWNSFWEPGQRRTYSYDQNGRLKEVIVEFMDNASWLLIDRLEYFYGSVGIKEKSSDFNVTVFPNPARSELSLAIDPNSPIEGPIEYCVYSIDGKRVLRSAIYSAELIKRIDISTLPPGLYTVEIMAGNFSYITKLIIK